MTDVAACAMRGLKRSKVEELLQIIIINLCLQLCVLYAHGPTLQRLGGLLGTSASVCFMHTGQHSKVLGGFLVCDTKRVRLQCMAQILCYCYYTNKGARSSKV